MAFTVFVSHSTASRVLAAHVTRAIRVAGAVPYCTPHSLPVGCEYPARLEAQIRSTDLFVLLWNGAARASSWVPQEIGFARAAGRAFWPLLLDDTPLEASFAMSRGSRWTATSGQRSPTCDRTSRRALHGRLTASARKGF
jgi:hypothetical protein